MNKTPREILGELLNIKTDYHVEAFSDTCMVCGFPLSMGARIKMIDQALVKINDYYNKEEK